MTFLPSREFFWSGSFSNFDSADFFFPTILITTKAVPKTPAETLINFSIFSYSFSGPLIEH